MFACVDCANPHTLRSGDKMKLQELQSVAEVISGYAFKSELIKSGHDRIIRIGDLQNGRVEIDSAITFDSADYGVSEQFRILENDILMALSGATVGKIAVAHNLKERCYLNQRVAIVRAKDKTSQSYLKYVFSGRYLEKLLMSAGGVAQPNLSPKSLEKMEIPLPDLPTQTQIAKILDKSTALIAKRKAQIAELDVLVQSVFLEMFGDPITNPKGWETKKLSEVAPIKSASASTLKEPVWLLNLDKVESNTGIILEKEFHFLKDIGSSTQAFTNENVLYCKLRPYLNKVVLPDENGISTSELLPLKPNHLILTREFLACYLRSEYFVNWANTKATGAKMPRLSTIDLKEHFIILPTKSLQDKFSEIYQKIQTQKSQLQQSLAELEMQHQALMQRAFRGELV